MGVDNKWCFAGASLEGPPSRKDGDGDMLRWQLLPRKLPEAFVEVAAVDISAERWTGPVSTEVAEV